MCVSKKPLCRRPKVTRMSDTDEYSGGSVARAADRPEPRLRYDERLVIFDTTLRDGAHSPLVSFSLDDKLTIAECLNEMGADIVEVGTPGASVAEYESVVAVSKILTMPVVCALAKPIRREIDVAAEATRFSVRRRLHTFISTSPHQMKAQGLTPDAVIEAIRESVSRARNYTDDVEWSGEDATRSDTDFLCRCVETAIRAGATTINIPDSAGWTTPTEYCHLIEALRMRIPGDDQAVFSVHCHNDIGLALANTLAGVEGGARQVECTLDGLGARAGNTSVSDVLMLLESRQDLLPYITSLDPAAIARAVSLVKTKYAGR